MVTLALTVTPPPNTNLTAAICEGDLYNLGSQNLTQPGTYIETFAGSQGCDSTVTLTLTFHVVDTSVQVNGNVISANLVATTYQWLDCDNGFAPLVGQDGQSLVVANDGHFAVIIYDGVCRDTSGCHFVLAIGLRDGLQEIVRVSPNPASAQIRIEKMDGSALGSLQLVGIDGRVVQDLGQISEANASVDLREVAAGMYFLRFWIDGSIGVLKVVRE
jgi:Secretion system C-terminal sorting domain